MSDARSGFRAIPSVDVVAQIIERLAPDVPAQVAVRAAREEIEVVRGAVRQGQQVVAPDAIAEAGAVRARLVLADAPSPVINATGVIIHTNLGRAPLSERALDAVQAAAGGYSDLEFDLATGQRGSRSNHIADVVREVTGAEAALVLNNNAAAVFLALEAHARGREVLVARGESIEIGGGFRIPDILQASGVRLRDVGTTNRTRVGDYARAVTDDTAAIMRVHPSNFAQVGFTESPDARELASLARECGLLLINDLGSGALLDTTVYGLAQEPLIGEALEAGADLVTFSGDKLLGGPQAGVIVGSSQVIEPIARRPLARALRPDKMTIAGLRATLGHYLRGEAVDEVPVWQMIAAGGDDLRARAERVTNGRNGLRVVDSSAAVGGGSLPGQVLPSVAIEVTNSKSGADDVARRLRDSARPVIGRIHRRRLRLDMRTVLPRDERALREVLQAL
ncbi:MAG: L-seryl-tRNA(Sec) selenium transferase [Chloroflexi bacterium]|nr:L-seryl-tRNA(Sec) selenium transferase [Chloroflexota bacterium]